MSGSASLSVSAGDAHVVTMTCSGTWHGTHTETFPVEYNDGVVAISGIDLATGKYIGTLHPDWSAVEGWLPVPGSGLIEEIRPNPFNGTTTIGFGIQNAGMVSLRIYDVTGALVRTLVDQETTSGRYQLIWDGLDLAGRTVAPGIYFSELKEGGHVSTRRIVRIR